ncbi:hypothetical protein H6G04_04975 [Calothrix membranacea FACHB-236]|nr:hypothetical protein [Calothrix membranacea FACHB-236]
MPLAELLLLPNSRAKIQDVDNSRLAEAKYLAVFNSVVCLQKLLVLYN